MVRANPVSVNAQVVRISHAPRTKLARYRGRPEPILQFLEASPKEASVALELQLGPRIRALRQARRLTLRDVSERAGVTESFLSQVERDVTSPSIATVQRIAHALDLSIAQLFAEEPATGRVVRREARRRVAYPGLKAVDEFLTANMAGKLQVILSTIEPGGGTGAEPYTHDSDEEVVVVLSGVLDLWVGDEHYVLREGDAITFPSRLPHWNMNHGETEAVVLFCVTPPSF
jgi:transcriptional regulator with XRE-family HTH domain